MLWNGRWSNAENTYRSLLHLLSTFSGSNLLVPKMDSLLTLVTLNIERSASRMEEVALQTYHSLDHPPSTLEKD